MDSTATFGREHQNISRGDLVVVVRDKRRRSLWCHSVCEFLEGRLGRGSGGTGSRALDLWWQEFRLLDCEPVYGNHGQAWAGDEPGRG